MHGIGTTGAPHLPLSEAQTEALRAEQLSREFGKSDVIFDDLRQVVESVVAPEARVEVQGVLAKLGFRRVLDANLWGLPGGVHCGRC